MSTLKKIEQEVISWPNVTAHSHRFGGREFRLGRAEIGHVHVGGTVDIPFTRPLHDELLAEGHAVDHRWVPNSGWVTFFARGDADCEHAIKLLRLSYLRYALKETPDPRGLLERESQLLQLSPRIKALLERFVSQKAAREEVAARAPVAAEASR